MHAASLRRTAALTVLWILIAVLSISTVTYAWFSISTVTNVTPLSGKIGQGGLDLLIANAQEGPFAVQCELLLREDAPSLRPVSTTDLSGFYASVQQDQDGISQLFSDVSGQIGRRALCGTLYLQSRGGDCDVFLTREGLDFGEDIQALAALRLGLRITTLGGTQTYILSLDNMADTTGAASRRTMPRSGVVVAGVDAGKRPTLAEDPARPIGGFFADGVTRQPLCRLTADEIGVVEFWLYLEGCDENCINAVQRSDVALQLAFIGA